MPHKPTLDELDSNVILFERIDAMTDTQRRDALIFLTGYTDHEAVTKACDYVTTRDTLERKRQCSGFSSLVP